MPRDRSASVPVQPRKLLAFRDQNFAHLFITLEQFGISRKKNSAAFFALVGGNNMACADSRSTGITSLGALRVSPGTLCGMA